MSAQAQRLVAEFALAVTLVVGVVFAVYGFTEAVTDRAVATCEQPR